MPAKQHVSFFVVWQAVRRQDVEKPTTGDFNIFLPFVAGGRPAAAADVAFSLATPEPGVDPFSIASLALLRAAAWNRLGLEYRADSPLADYARRNALGMPVTQEFMAGNLVAQGYQGGIVYALVSERENVRHMSW
jgi:hypothetical protein